MKNGFSCLFDNFLAGLGGEILNVRLARKVSPPAWIRSCCAFGLLKYKIEVIFWIFQKKSKIGRGTSAGTVNCEFFNLFFVQKGRLGICPKV